MDSTKLPKKQIEVEFCGKSYEVKFPNNKQYQKIQSLKSQLLPDSFNMEFGGAESQFAVLLVETQAHLTVMSPTLVKDLPAPFDELDLMQVVELVEVYKQVRAWYNQWLEIIFKVGKTEGGDKQTS